MHLYKAQGAFEYMTSYGWAILLLLVLGILLFSLGVFNPSQEPNASGFTTLKPVSWSFTGGNLDRSNVTIALENVAGHTLIIYVNDTITKNSIKFSTGTSLPCYFNWSFGGPTTKDTAGNSIPITDNMAAVPAGAIITINGTIDGYGNGTPNSRCGGLINQAYRYNVYIVTKDVYNVERTDVGTITGTYI